MENIVQRESHLLIPFSKLAIKEGFNVRMDMGDITELANSIKENGVKEPLRGYKERGGEVYIITDGHRRYKAMEKLHQAGINVSAKFMLEEKGYNDEQRVLDMLICNSGKPLTQLEEAEVFGRLVKYGWPEDQIALRAGKSKTHVANCLSLLAAPTSLKKQIAKGEVSASLVIEMAKENKGDMAVVQEKVIAAAAVAGEGKKITRKGVEAAARGEKKVVRKKRGKVNTKGRYVWDLIAFLEMSDVKKKKEAMAVLNMVEQYMSGEVELEDPRILKMFTA